MNENPPDPWVLVGKIGKPIGLAGSIRVWSEAELDAIFEKQVALLLWNGVDEPEIPIRLVEIDRDGKGWVVRFEGQETRETAREWTHWLLVAKREDLPEPDPDSVYWSDLMGAEVVTKEGEVLGTVMDLYETSSNTLLQIHSPLGEEFLVPLTEEVDAEIDKTTGPSRLSIHLPDGMREATTVEQETKPRPGKRRSRAVNRKGKRA